jgi:ABC-type branched-subunit amino acid transport system substrate-binding protein
MWTFFLLLLSIYFTRPLDAITIEPEFRLGVLYATHDYEGRIDFNGNQYIAAVLMAVREINNKHDGIEDDLLPNTKIVVAARSPQRNLIQGALAAKTFIDDVFKGQPIHACVGPVSNDASYSSQLLFSYSDIPQISYGADCDDLSVAATYKYFSRTYPSESFQGRALSKLILNTFDWHYVSIFHSEDVHYARVASEFELESDGIKVMELVQVDVSEDFNKYFQQSQSIGTQIFVLSLTPVDAARFLVEGHTFGLFRPGTQVIGVEELNSPEFYTELLKRVSYEKMLEILKGFITLQLITDHR